MPVTSVCTNALTDLLSIPQTLTNTRMQSSYTSHFFKTPLRSLHMAAIKQLNNFENRHQAGNKQNIWYYEYAMDLTFRLMTQILVFYPSSMALPSHGQLPNLDRQKHNVQGKLYGNSMTTENLSSSTQNALWWRNTSCCLYFNSVVPAAPRSRRRARNQPAGIS